MEQKNSKKTMSFTRMDRMVLESYKTLCEGLAQLSGGRVRDRFAQSGKLRQLRHKDYKRLLYRPQGRRADHRSCAAYAGGYPPQQRQGLYRLLFKKQKGRAHAFHDDRHPQREREDRRAAVH